MNVGVKNMIDFLKHKDYKGVEREFLDLLNDLERQAKKNMKSDKVVDNVGMATANILESIYVQVFYMKESKKYMYNCWIEVDGITVSYTNFLTKRSGFEYSMSTLIARIFVQLKKENID